MKKKMSEKYKILSQFVKDLSCETKDVETYLFVQDIISRYHLNIDINSKAIKNKMIEVNTILNFKDPENNKFHSIFEMTYTTIIKVEDKIENKEELQKILLCDVQEKVFPDIKKTFLNFIHSSGYKNVSFDKEINFEELYNQQFNQK
tara:strand:+ start:824 stop:1264 length:441 start_codon:yes stop_codon:yes gene_type:complete